MTTTVSQERLSLYDVSLSLATGVTAQVDDVSARHSADAFNVALAALGLSELDLADTGDRVAYVTLSEEQP